MGFSAAYKIHHQQSYYTVQYIYNNFNLVKNYINIRDQQNSYIIKDEIIKPILYQYLGEISDESIKCISTKNFST